MTAAEVFIERSIFHLHDEYLPRLRQAVAVLPDEELWWRPHGGANSVGNLLLHLEGNVRQWILAGLGDHSDDRRRSTEFATKKDPSVSQLLDALEATVNEACAVIADLGSDDLERSFSIQGFEPKGLEAIYHVVEHFSWHLGQIAYVAKMRAGASHGLHYYDDSTLENPGNE